MLALSSSLVVARTLRARVFMVALVSSAAVWAQPKAPLPLERVRLYEVGVGYFERAGRLDDGAASLPVPAGHLDDALKTLVVFEADGKTTVSGIRFSSSTSRGLGLALAGLPGEDGAPLTLTRVLASLKGVRVDLVAGTRSLRGRLADVMDAESSDLEEYVAPAAQQHDPAPGPQRRSAVVLVADDGGISRIPLDELTTVKPLDPALRQRFQSALDALSRGSVREPRTLTLQASGSRGLRLGYVAETPVWRATYRVLLGDASAKLQGWALIHNDTDEDWRGVKLELVNGRPQSVLSPLAAPRYERRALVAPAVELPTVPQLLEASPDELWSSDTDATAMVPTRPFVHGADRKARSAAFKSAPPPADLETIYYSALDAPTEGAPAAPPPPRPAALPSAVGSESYALFQYALARPVDLRARSSALVPFVDQDIEAQRIAWFAARAAVARSGVELTNRTPQTLPAGMLSVFSDGGFAGEAELRRVKPDEAALVLYGADPDVARTELAHRSTDAPWRFAGKGSRLVRHFVRQHTFHFRMENRGNAARRVYVELPLIGKATIRGGDGAGADPERGGTYVACDLAPHSVRELQVHGDERLRDEFELGDLTARWVRAMAQSTALPAAERARLRQSAGWLARSESLDARRAGMELEMTDLRADVSHLRADLGALGRSGRRAAARLADRLLAAETRLTLLRARSRALLAERNEWRTRAERALQALGRDPPTAPLR